MILIFLTFIEKPPHVCKAINFISYLGVSIQGWRWVVINMKPVWRSLHNEHCNYRTTVSNFNHDFDLSKMENYMDKDPVCVTSSVNISWYKYTDKYTVNISKFTAEQVHSELSSNSWGARVTRGALNVLFVKFSYDFTHNFWGYKTSSLLSVNWDWFPLSALVSLQMLKLQEANDDHLMFPANWRACICLGVKIKFSSVIMNYAVSISIIKTSLVKKLLKFWKVYEVIFHSQKWQRGSRLLFVAPLYTFHAHMHKTEDYMFSISRNNIFLYSLWGHSVSCLELFHIGYLGS